MNQSWTPSARSVSHLVPVVLRRQTWRQVLVQHVVCTSSPPFVHTKFPTSCKWLHTQNQTRNITNARHRTCKFLSGQRTDNEFQIISWRPRWRLTECRCVVMNLALYWRWHHELDLLKAQDGLHNEAVWNFRSNFTPRLQEVTQALLNYSEWQQPLSRGRKRL